jgi:hypothetical protein
MEHRGMTGSELVAKFRELDERTAKLARHVSILQARIEVLEALTKKQGNQIAGLKLRFGQKTKAMA